MWRVAFNVAVYYTVIFKQIPANANRVVQQIGYYIKMKVMKENANNLDIGGSCWN